MHCSRDTPVGYGRSRPIAVGQSAQFGGVAVRIEVRPNFSRGHSGQLWGGPPGREDVLWHCIIRSGKNFNAVVFSELPLADVYRFWRSITTANLLQTILNLRHSRRLNLSDQRQTPRLSTKELDIGGESPGHTTIGAMYSSGGP